MKFFKSRIAEMIMEYEIKHFSGKKVASEDRTRLVAHIVDMCTNLIKSENGRKIYHELDKEKFDFQKELLSKATSEITDTPHDPLRFIPHAVQLLFKK